MADAGKSVILHSKTSPVLPLLNGHTEEEIIMKKNNKRYIAVCKWPQYEEKSCLRHFGPIY